MDIERIVPQTRAGSADCGHWIAVGGQFWVIDGKKHCALCALKHAATPDERRAILRVPAPQGG